MSDAPSFFSELKRRNVYKVAVAYAVVGWLLVQVATQVFPFFEIPNWAVRLVVLIIIVGFPIALVVAWAFELTPEGIKRTEVADAMPAAVKPKKHAWIFVVVIGAAISVGLFWVVTPRVPRLLPWVAKCRTSPSRFFHSQILVTILTTLILRQGFRTRSLRDCRRSEI